MFAFRSRLSSRAFFGGSLHLSVPDLTRRFPSYTNKKHREVLRNHNRHLFRAWAEAKLTNISANRRGRQRGAGRRAWGCTESVRSCPASRAAEADRMCWALPERGSAKPLLPGAPIAPPSLRARPARGHVTRHEHVSRGCVSRVPHQTRREEPTDLFRSKLGLTLLERHGRFRLSQLHAQGEFRRAHACLLHIASTPSELHRPSHGRIARLSRPNSKPRLYATCAATSRSFLAWISRIASSTSLSSCFARS
jgi:hypothetical protein